MLETLRSQLRARLARLSKKAFRDAFVRANVEQGLAHQIRILRQAKGWSQQKLALKIGASGQSAIARLEDPSYGRFTLATLLRVAAAFDVALLVKFVSYGKLLGETADLSPAGLMATSFDAEYPNILKSLAAGEHKAEANRSPWLVISTPSANKFIEGAEAASRQSATRSPAAEQRQPIHAIDEYFGGRPRSKVEEYLRGSWDQTMKGNEMAVPESWDQTTKGSEIALRRRSAASLAAQ